MKKTLVNILEHYEFSSIENFLNSLFPSLKFDLSAFLITIGMITGVVQEILGISFPSILGLLVMMVLELVTGIMASSKRKEPFSSLKLSRFGVKTTCYLVLIGVPYMFYTSYEGRGNTLAAGLFNWLHVFLVIHIVLEHLISLLENLASIQGKEKSYWIEILKNKINTKL